MQAMNWFALLRPPPFTDEERREWAAFLAKCRLPISRWEDDGGFVPPAKDVEET